MGSSVEDTFLMGLQLMYAVTHVSNQNVQFAYCNVEKKRAYYAHGSHEDTLPSICIGLNASIH